MSGAIKILALDADERWQEIRTIDPARDMAAWYLFADVGAILHPRLADLLRVHGAERPDIDIFYGDEVVADAPGRAPRYLCKPAFDATQLLARDYIGLPFAVRAGAMAALGDADPAAGSARYYDLLLRAMADDIGIDRVTEVLAVNPKARFEASPADRLAAARRILPRYRPGCRAVQGLAQDTIEIQRDFDEFPEITLVIPTLQVRPPRGARESGDQPMVLSLLHGICRSDWPMDRLTVLIGDDLDDGAIYQSRSWPFRLERIVAGRAPPGAFNYARKLNALWPRAKTDHLIILNDDLLVRGPGWIKALMTFAVDDGVGGVGARLLYPDDRIQHAGMPLGVGGACAHAFIGAGPTSPTYQDWAIVQREWSVVTGAVFATRRSLLAQVNGFDERFSLDYNDVDLCLRLRLLGYRIVYTPHAELTHFESASRGKSGIPADQTALFLEKWQDYVRDDPAYHPNLTRATPDIHPIIPTHAWWSALAAGLGSTAD
jgi:hypothetical protein